MGIGQRINEYFANDKAVFAIILYTILIVILVMFIAAFIHGYKGTRYPFVLWMAAATVADVIMYSIYSFLQLFCNHNRTHVVTALTYSLAIAIFQVQHWIIAFTYYKCASELQYVESNTRTPDKEAKT